MMRALRHVPAPLRWRAITRRNVVDSFIAAKPSPQASIDPIRSTVRPAQANIRHFHQTTRFQEAAGEQRAVEFQELRGTIHETVIDTITKRMGLKTMTDVQSLTIHEALKGQDILGQAKTGTGKTVAFLLPILQRVLLDDPTLANPNQRGRGAQDIRAVIISPTRELAEQIAVEAKKLTQNTGIRVQTGVGGTQKSMHLRKMQVEGCHILVGTPGRLKDLLSDQRARVEAPNLTALVLDEADRLMDDGFYPEIQEISQMLPSPRDVERQTMLFSATMDREVLGLARQLMRRDYHHVQTVNDTDEPTHERVPQNIVTVPSLENMLPAVFELCEREIAAHEGTDRPFKAIVYFNATAETDLAASIFLQTKLTLRPERWDNTRVYRIHSRLTQQQRTAASDSFRRDKGAVLFSSDVTARGMDFPDVTHVIQAGLPNSRDTYIHRIGRTGRAGKEGTGWLIIPDAALGEARGRIGDLPLKRNDTLEFSKVDFSRVAPGQMPDSLTPAGKEILDKIKTGASKLDRFAYIDAYKAFLGVYQWVRDKNWLVNAMNRMSSVVWGMEKPPGISRMLAQKLNLLGIQGINIMEERPRDDRMGGFGGDRRSDFGGDRRRGGGGGFGGDRRGGGGFGGRGSNRGGNMRSANF